MSEIFYRKFIYIFINIPFFLFSWLKYKLEIFSYYYFYLNKSIISDIDYDFLYDNFNYLNKKYNINDLINFNLIKSKNLLCKYKHITPMLSIYSSSNFFKIFNYSKKVFFFLKNYFSIKNIFYICDFKFDGVAISLIYKNGIFFKGLTRGDGILGEDITFNILKVNSIPKKLNTSTPPILIEIRGEILLKKKDYIYIFNKKKNKIDDFIFSSRNLASGILRQKKVKNFLNFLNFYAHSVGYLSFEYKIKTQKKLLCNYKKWGFNISKFFINNFNFYNIYFLFNNIRKYKKRMPYQIDGIVFKINNFAQQKKIGYSFNFPNFYFSYKFYDFYGISEILDIYFNVNKIGVLIPIAILKTFSINNIFIKNINLFSFNEIFRKNINIGDKVLVYMSGDIIPYIVKVLKKKINSEFLIPKFCPICKSLLVFEDKYLKVKCISSLNCFAQIKNKLKHFCSKNGFNIIGLGNNIIKSLVDNFYLISIVDLFKLSFKDLITIKGLNKNLSIKILFSIKNSVNISLDRFIYSLGINYIGLVLSKKLSNFSKKINTLVNLKKNDLKKIGGLGDKVIDSIYIFFNDFNNRFVIYNLLFYINII